METSVKILVVAALAVAVSLVIILKKRQAPEAAAHVHSTAGLPKLLDPGADECIPCKAMAPSLGGIWIISSTLQEMKS